MSSESHEDTVRAWAEYRAACPSPGDHGQSGVLLEGIAWKRLRRQLLLIRRDQEAADLDAIPTADPRAAAA